MSASGGPAADNNELRAQLEATLSGMFAEPRYVVEQFWQLVVAFGDARYQEGRNDAAEAIVDEGDGGHYPADSSAAPSWAARLARGEG